MTKFFLNFRTLTGENPAWYQTTEATFVKLAAGRAILLTPVGLAIYHGRGALDPARVTFGEPGEVVESSEWLQFWLVPVFGLTPVNPLAVDSADDLVYQATEMTEEETPPTMQDAHEIATQIINGIAVEGFENDADAVKALQGQLSSVAEVVSRIMDREK